MRLAELRENEAAVMRTLQTSGGSSTFDEIVQNSKQDNAAVTRALAILLEKQFVKVSEMDTIEVHLTNEGLEYANHGLPERRLLQAVLELGGEATLEQAAKHASIPATVTRVALGWVKSSNWCDISTRLQEIVLRLVAFLRKQILKKLWKQSPASTTCWLMSCHLSYARILTHYDEDDL